MGQLDDDLKAHARSNLITWINYSAVFLAGVIVGLLLMLAFT